MRTLGRADDVPHLVLAMSAMSFPRKFIAGMDLDAQVLPGVDELYQERKLGSGLGDDFLSGEFLAMLYH